MLLCWVDNLKVVDFGCWRSRPLYKQKTKKREHQLIYKAQSISHLLHNVQSSIRSKYDFIYKSFLITLPSLQFKQNMENNGFEHPKLAITRLLNARPDTPATNSQPSEELARMMAYRQELLQQVALERSKIAEIPCVITLAQEIEELQQVVGGLGRQNKSRLQYLRRISSRQGRGVCQQQKDGRWQQERLQGQYVNLMKALQNVNEHNRRLVQRLTVI